MKILRKLFVVLFIFFIAVGVYFAGYWIVTGNPPNMLSEISSGVDNKTVLIMGMDKGGTRSDVMMVAFINGKTGSVDILSIPRDTKVKINSKTYKINSAYAIGEEELAISTVEELLGISIDNYVKITFDTFRNVIDALGGVDYYVPQDMKYSDPYQDLYIDLKEGMQHLDGDKAEQLVRFRNYPMGDLKRIEVQQDFLKELVKQKLNPSILLKLPALVNEIGNCVETDIPSSQWMGYANLARKMTADSVRTYEMPRSLNDNTGVSYVIINEAETEKLIAEIQARQNETETAASPSAESEE